MVRKRKLSTKESAKSAGAIEETPSSNTYTVVVDSHTHAGVLYHSGDPITLEHPATVEKLKRRGIIS